MSFGQIAKIQRISGDGDGASPVLPLPAVSDQIITPKAPYMATFWWETTNGADDGTVYLMQKDSDGVVTHVQAGSDFVTCGPQLPIIG